MHNYFNELSGKLFALLKGNEILLLNCEGEESDFVRLNHNRIRQAGRVKQQSLQLNLIGDGKQNSASFQLRGDATGDFEYARYCLSQLREQLPLLPEDPFLNITTEPKNTTYVGENHLPRADEAVQSIMDTAAGLDLVGIWASGAMINGFANSLGQFNWHSTNNFNFDWSLYLKDDKAVKQCYAGFEWRPEVLRQKIDSGKQSLELLTRPAKTLQPGRYRVFLTPTALNEITGLLGWGGFGLKSHRTAQTPLLKMSRDGVKLHSKVNFVENHEEGLGPRFTRVGFIKPDAVTLIKDGEYQATLNGARSAKEYSEVVNANNEQPQSLQLGRGGLKQADVFKALDTGIYVSNLWYGNYSDRSHCRITGMTRFACLWVENGEPVAPVNVMRFDETLYHMLGDHLIDFTEEREHIFDPGTYESRSQASALLPGALIDGFRLTL